MNSPMVNLQSLSRSPSSTRASMHNFLQLEEFLFAKMKQDVANLFLAVRYVQQLKSCFEFHIKYQRLFPYAK